MKKDLSKANDLFNDFSKRNEKVDRSKYKVPERRKTITDKRKTRKTTGKPYQEKFRLNEIDKISSKDMLEFFKDLAYKNGIKYIESKPTIAMRNFNLALERGYTKEEVLVMIEFLFESEQDYLDKTRLHPGIILTAWGNTIYHDSQLWLNDEYKTKSQKKHEKREWAEEVPKEDSANIGEWGI